MPNTRSAKPTTLGAFMTPRLFASLFAIAGLVGCAGGSTIRASEGEEDTGSGPVSLAPAPASQPESTPSTQPQPQQTPYQPQSATPAQGYAPYGDANTPDIRRIGQWTRTGIAEARRLVIRNANTWDQFWSELGTGERPVVDFTRDLVIAVAAGQRPTGGYEIAVDKVTRADGELSIEVIERTPSPNCVTTASLTQPVDVVVVPAADARSWSFLERKEIRSCR